ncbi:TKL protein kinase, partial [Saprolegnia parasitica CBS 223.65]
HLSRNPLTAVPEGLPSALDALYLDGCLITSLEQLPPRIGSLHLESNRLSALSSVDFDVENLYFGELPAASTVWNDIPGNPIDTIYNVTFSARLRLFDCPHCAITTFVVNEAAYAALQAATLSFKSVTFNATACNTVLGRPAVLDTWSICVLPAPDATTDGPSTAVLVQIVAGCLVLVMAAILLFVWRRRRQHRHSSTVVFEVYDDGDVTPVTSMYEPRETLDSCSLIIPELDTIKHLRLEASDILLVAPMSQGSYGEVWLAQYKQETIAIKKPMPSFLSATNMRRMIGEILLLSRLASPYVVTLLGACWNRPMDLMMAMEHMDGGNLQGHLARHSQISLPWSFKLQSLVQIAEALAYLHAIPVVHRDLKCKNVLLDEKKGTKLGGFSISRETSATMTLGAGGHRWMAPEVLHAADYSTAVDIFSFGMVLTECDSHRAPYDREMDPDTGKLLAEVAIARRVALGFSTELATITHYLPCIGNRTSDPRCDVRSNECVLCPPGYPTSCCLTIQGKSDTNMDGEFTSHYGMEAEGGHAMLLVGYNDEYTTKDGYTGGYILKNSWWDGVARPLGPPSAHGSHSIRYFMQEISEFEERFNCPNSANPANWYQCQGRVGVIHADAGVIRAPINASLVAYDECLSDDTRRDAASSFSPLRLSCTNDAFCKANATYFVRNSTAVGDGFQTFCFFEYLGDSNSSDVCLPAMLPTDIAHAFAPVEAEAYANNPDVCGFYFYPYAKQRAGAALGWEVSADDLDVTWAPQSYAANAHKFPTLDYTLVRQSTKVQKAAPVLGPIPVYVARDEL